MKNGFVVVALALMLAGTASAQSRRNSFKIFPGVDQGRAAVQGFDTRDPNMPVAAPQPRNSGFDVMKLLPNIPSFNTTPSMVTPRSTFPTPAQMPGMEYLKAFQFRTGQ